MGSFSWKDLVFFGRVWDSVFGRVWGMNLEGLVFRGFGHVARREDPFVGCPPMIFLVLGFG